MHRCPAGFLVATKRIFNRVCPSGRRVALVRRLVTLSLFGLLGVTYGRVSGLVFCISLFLSLSLVAASFAAGGRRGSRVTALEAELKDGRRGRLSSGNNANNNENHTNNSNYNSKGSNNLLSVQQKRALMEDNSREASPRGGKAGGSGG